MKSFYKMFAYIITMVSGLFAAPLAMAGTTTATLSTTGSLYTGLVTNVLNGEIGTVVAIGLVAFGVFMLFRSAAMGVLSLAAAVVFWNAETILNTILGLVI